MTKRIYDKSFDKLRGVFRTMKARCYNPNTNRYYLYGAKGIKVCDEWLKNPLNFCIWAINNGYKEGLSIDRINVNGNYEPSNCRWVDAYVQANNKSNIPLYNFNGGFYSIAELSRIYNINKSTLVNRLKRGWSLEKSLLTSPRKYIK